ncbi:MAG: restriction endonuclease [Candidatus Berkelbacteria bacterium]|nr:restriction endonuclease [Candidatus Berkelbacteria bacterium]
MKDMSIDSRYFREYRIKLGFKSQGEFKSFLSAKDITPTVNYEYIELLNQRLVVIIEKINSVVRDEIKQKDLGDFSSQFVFEIYKIMKNGSIIPRLNNQGRRPEQVYFSWMRGFVITQYFTKAISIIFGVNIKNILQIGDDDLTNLETFKRTPKADIEINLGASKKVILEIQSGFQGINDIKQHKVIEAKRLKQETGDHTIAIHFDLYNGQVAFIVLDLIKETDMNWITRQQMEGQTVFNIDQNYFIWKLTELPPQIEEIKKLLSF